MGGWLAWTAVGLGLVCLGWLVWEIVTAPTVPDDPLPEKRPGSEPPAPGKA